MWTVDTEEVTVALPDRKIQYLLNLLDIPAMQRRIGHRELEHLMVKLRSM